MTLYLYEKATVEYLDTLSEGNIIFIGRNKKKRWYISRLGDIIKYYDYKNEEKEADIDDVFRRKR
jgi:hypothetical protein